jgi:hypothetical protein
MGWDTFWAIFLQTQLITLILRLAMNVRMNTFGKYVIVTK